MRRAPATVPAVAVASFVPGWPQLSASVLLFRGCQCQHTEKGTWCRSIAMNTVLASLVPERASATPRSPHFENHRFRQSVESLGWGAAQSRQEKPSTFKEDSYINPSESRGYVGKKRNSIYVTIIINSDSL